MEGIKDKDSGGFDICQITQKTLQEMYTVCQFIPYAEGFNSGGWLKYHISDELAESPGNTLFKLVNRTGPVDQLTTAVFPEIYCICEPDRFDKLEFMKMQIGDHSKLKTVLFTEESNETLFKKITEPTVFITDECILCEDFYEKISHLLALTEHIKWDIIYIGFKNNLEKELWNAKFPKIKPFDPDLFKNGKSYGYIVNRQGAKKILENVPNLEILMSIPHLVKVSNDQQVENKIICAQNENYKFFLENLQFHINNSDIKTFKDWECFGKRGLWIYVPDDHLANSKYEQNLIIALSRFTFQHLKDPVPTKHTRKNGTDPLIIRNAADFAKQNIDLTKYDNIIEIGAGYGALANVLLNSGYTGTYTIYDFELMEKVHRHYIQHEFEFVSDPEKLPSRPKTLLISTWGISEMPSELVEKILTSLEKEYKFDGIYLIAQNNYESRNNVEYFEQLLGRHPKIYDDRSVIFIQH